MAKRPSQSDESDGRRALDATNQPWFALYEESLATLAEAAASGASDTDLVLADIVDKAPKDMRDALVQRFRALLQEKKKEQSAPPLPELTPEQERILELMAEHEQLVLAHIMSKKTLEKIRRAFLSNPKLLEEVLGLGDELYRRGLFIEQGKVKSRELGDIDTQNVRNTEQVKKDKERER